MQNLSKLYFPTEYPNILERINNINPIKYATTRNFINGQITYLSPYISRGVISTKQVLDAVVNKNNNVFACEKLIQELSWREYYQRVWQQKSHLIGEDLKQSQTEVAHHSMISNIQNANTGIDIIDKNIQSLYEQGYLHNHIRMYIAAMVCNMGKAHWAVPAKWMYYHLLDADVASNNCSWQWVAGSFSSKKYYCNQENINKYTHTHQVGTFLDKPYEALVNMPIPISLQQTHSLNLSTTLPRTQLPIIDTNLPTLIYNSYNLDPIWRKEENVNRVLLLEPSHFNKYPISEKVLAFIINLSKNIPHLQLYVGEIQDIQKIYGENVSDQTGKIISKEHPIFNHYPGIKDERDWMFPEVTGYFPSFFSFWKKCQKYLKY